MRRSLSILSLSCVLLLNACGGGGSSAVQTSTGYFIDSAVAGLTYTSGSQTGVTGEDGSFIYEVGQPVTFKVGNIVLGSVTVDQNKRVFPVDLISGAADESDPKVSLIARLLQTLDSDNNPSNGISINEAGRARINQLITLANTDLLAAENALKNGNSNFSLIGETAAQQHLRSNLVKEYAGRWTGNYSGDDQGPCTVNISANGSISGVCTSQKFTNVVATLSGSVASSGQSAAGDTSTGAQFNGTYQRAGQVNGSWANGELKGTFSLTRQSL